MAYFSIIIPVYNRPQEVKELLGSLAVQTCKDFEVIIVEDGSQERSEQVVTSYGDLLDVKYFYKENSGPGLSRNYGQIVQEECISCFWILIALFRQNT